MNIRYRILRFFVGEEASSVTPHERKTFFLDTLRSGVDGIEVTLAPSVFLLIAIQFFQVSDIWKSIISSATFIGLIFSLFTAALLGNKKPTNVSGYSTITGGFFLIFAAFTDNALVFCSLLIVHSIFMFIRAPLFTAIFEVNYSPTRRAKLFSAGIMFAIVTGLASNYFFGRLLDINLEYYKLIFCFSGFFLIISGILLLNIPYEFTGRKIRRNPLKNLALLYKNPIFGIVSLSWFIMGFANLWSIPLRIVYLAEADRGLGLSPFLTLIIIGFIPNAVKLLFSNLWARIFDRFDFLPIRIITTLLMGIGIFLFFLTENIAVIITGQVIMNIGLACSPFIWNLWVTKIVPQGESQPYMSVHTFLCGVRGVMGPFLGFLFVQNFPMRYVGTISFAMVMVSIAILIPMLKKWSKSTI